jgi:DNA-nicking Smr family endonuclease
MNVKTTLSLEEIALFRESVSDVKRVRSEKIAQRPRPPAPVAYQTRLDQARVMNEILDFDFNSTELQPGDYLNFCRPGVQHTVMRKLRRGQYRVSAELDLHGMNTETARRALIEFIHQAKTAGARCVRVVHGKGHRSNNRGPVIKPLVGHILRRSGDVLAFCSARPVDGGTGAVYVLLKSS